MAPAMIWYAYARKHRDFTILGVFLWLSAMIKLGTVITAKSGIHNMPLYHLLALVEVCLVFCFYSRLIFGGIKAFSVITLIALNLTNSLFFQSYDQFNSVAWTLDMMVIITMGMIYLFRLYNNESDSSPLETRPGFIITAGWLIYASGSLFTYLLGSSILSGKAEGFYHNAWILQCLSNLFKNFLISIGLWKAR